ncbi:MAG: hypothetical protein LC798_13575 [Chloroflexi bacterium]|nr:hypothetical protein [Chloroflexota bacterium]
MSAPEQASPSAEDFAALDQWVAWKANALADWIDVKYPIDVTPDVQRDLRALPAAIRSMLAAARRAEKYEKALREIEDQHARSGEGLIDRLIDIRGIARAALESSPVSDVSGLIAEARRWANRKAPPGTAIEQAVKLVRRLADALLISASPWKAARGCLPPHLLGRKPEEVIRELRGELRGHPPGAPREDA